MIRGVLCAAAVAGLMFGVVTCMAEEPGKEKAAVASAEKWLSLVDQGKYGESWTDAAEIFRNAVKQEQWAQALEVVRKPLGKVVSRKEKSALHMTSLFGAPEGQYVVIEYETSFENKAAAIETVTPMMDKDGTWRVSGYYIK